MLKNRQNCSKAWWGGGWVFKAPFFAWRNKWSAPYIYAVSLATRGIVVCQ